MGNFGPASGISRANILDSLRDPAKAWCDKDDFHALTLGAVTASGWTSTVVGSGAVTLPETLGSGGIVRLGTGGTTDDDGAQIQRGGTEQVLAQAGKPIFFEARVKIDDLDETSHFIGLCNVDTTILTTDGTLTQTLYVGFYQTAATISAAGAGYLYFAVKNGTGSNVMANTTGILLAVGTWALLSFYLDFDQNFVLIFKDEVLIERLALTRANIPQTTGTGEMTMSAAIKNEGTATQATNLDIDYMLVAQAR